MIPMVFVAFGILLLCATLYVTLRRQHHGGLAGGAMTLSPPRTHAGSGPGRVYTAEEVSAHCTQDSLWLIIEGKVYDFTQYLSLHPGGESMMRNAGKDSTIGFSGSQHPARVWDMIDEFYIGDLEKISPISTKED